MSNKMINQLTSTATTISDDDYMVIDQKNNTDDNYTTKKISVETLKDQLDSSALFDDIYPIGSIYITIGATLPPKFTQNGRKWVQLATGRTLWNVNGNSELLGNKIEAGLPNITGSLGHVYGSGTSGCFSNQSGAGDSKDKNDGATCDKALFDASRSSKIYGKSTTVQPPSIGVTMWRRIDPSESVTVTFLDYDGTEIQTRECIIGDTIEAPQNPEHQELGFSFNGWDRDLTITEDTTITAIYKYTITLGMNVAYGTIYIDDDKTTSTTTKISKTCYTNEPQHTIKVIPKPDDAEVSASTHYYYDFSKWESSSTEESYTDTELTVPMKTDTYTATINRNIMKAVSFTSVSNIIYSISTGSNGASGSHYFRPGTMFDVEISSKSPTTYRTDGWTEATLNLPQVTQDETNPNIIRVTVGDDSTLTLKANPAKSIRLVQFDTQCDSIVESFYVDYNTPIPENKMPNTTDPDGENYIHNEGHEFDGWWTAATGGTRKELETYKITVNQTLYAHWTQITPQEST